MPKNDKDVFVSIGASIAGIMIPIALFVGIFAEQDAWVLAPIAASFAAMGIALGYFASKKK